MRKSIIPFATAEPHDVWFNTRWHLVVNNVAIDLGEFIADWDYMRNLQFRSEVGLSLADIRASTHQGTSAEFVIVVSAASSATRLRGPLLTVQVPEGKKAALVLDAGLCGSEVGGRLDLHTSLILMRPDPTSPLGAALTGAVLWRDRVSVALEGDASQFPTESTDLSQPPYCCPRAGWRLEADMDDLDADAALAVRLLVNDSHPVMQAELGSPASEGKSLILDTMRWDVSRQLITLALKSEDFIERSGSFDEGSLGWSLTNIVARYFPNESPMSLRALLHSSPAEFEARLQSAAGIFS